MEGIQNAVEEVFGRGIATRKSWTSTETRLLQKMYKQAKTAGKVELAKALLDKQSCVKKRLSNQRRCQENKIYKQYQKRLSCMET